MRTVIAALLLSAPVSALACGMYIPEKRVVLAEMLDEIDAEPVADTEVGPDGKAKTPPAEVETPAPTVPETPSAS